MSARTSGPAPGTSPGRPATVRTCKDCPADVRRPRPAPHPGPRCATHHRARRKAGRLAAWAVRLAARFGLTPADWEAIYAEQGGTCYICGRTRGTTKRLAVEHDHDSLLIRGLACGPCNWLLAKLGDDPARFRAIADALEDPPAVRAIGRRYAPSREETR